METAQDICPEDLNLIPARALSLVIAEIIERSRWAHDNITFDYDGGNIYFRVGSLKACITGYNFAYQVKICMDLFDAAGYFR